MTSTLEMRDRQVGCLVGLAVGDALGAAVEFQAPGSFVLVRWFRGGGPHGLAAGEWTDDTSMALALAESLVVAGFDLDDQARRYVAWWRDGAYSVNGRCFDIGHTVRAGLTRFLETGDASCSGSLRSEDSGNGSIMRLAPVPIRYAATCYPERITELAEFAERSSVPTHGSDLCRSACRYLAVVLAALMHGESLATVLDPQWPVLQRLRAAAPLAAEVDEVAAGSFRQRKPPRIRGSGYVVESLEAALWAVHDAADFREAVLRAVNLGDDADTTGAVAGQLAGAHWGHTGIPPQWRRDLAQHDRIQQAALDLAAP